MFSLLTVQAFDAFSQDVPPSEFIIDLSDERLSWFQYSLPQCQDSLALCH